MISPKPWRLADLPAKPALLYEGIGWANMPLATIATDLASGALVLLKLPDPSCGDYAVVGDLVPRCTARARRLLAAQSFCRTRPGG